MPTCQQCGATVPEGAVNCSNCEADIDSPSISTSASQPQTSPIWPRASSSGDVSSRLEKALRRSEQLGYAAAGLGVAIIVAILVIYFL